MGGVVAAPLTYLPTSPTNASRKMGRCQRSQDRAGSVRKNMTVLNQVLAEAVRRRRIAAKAVQRMPGHSSATLTLDRYGRLFEDDHDAVADRLEAHFTEASAVECSREAVAKLRGTSTVRTCRPAGWIRPAVQRACS
ncbi:hypothetical protein [Nocardia callitridis]|uniref:Integrase n=1 Tax=Nocardia callitridis TaxID=648753 RepID=A0ABP9KVJ0_9NOCA